MIRHAELVEDFECRYADEHRLDYSRALALYEAMFEHARRLGVLPSRDPLDGIETDLELARMLNFRKPA
jgi:hypothetical protein